MACSSKQGNEVVNNQKLSLRIVAYLADKHNNRCDELPAGVDLQSCPQLTVQPDRAGSSSAATRFAQSDTPQSGSLQRRSSHAGPWTYENGVLCMPNNLAIVGPAGSIRLSLTGGTNMYEQLLEGDTLTLQLSVGKMARQDVTGWPPGVLHLTPVPAMAWYASANTLLPLAQYQS